MKSKRKGEKHIVKLVGVLFERVDDDDCGSEKTPCGKWTCLLKSILHYLF